MNNDQLKEYIDSIEAKMASRFSKLEKTMVSELHQHAGFDGNKVRVKDLDTIFYRNITLDPGSLADGVGATLQVTNVAGATLGDFVLVSAPYDLQDITVTGYVQANSTVEIRLQNESGSTIDLASGTWRILVIKKVL